MKSYSDLNNLSGARITTAGPYFGPGGCFTSRRRECRTPLTPSRWKFAGKNFRIIPTVHSKTIDNFFGNRRLSFRNTRNLERRARKPYTSI